jgi:hypothetical protein
LAKGKNKSAGGCDPCCGKDPTVEAKTKQGPGNDPYLEVDSYKNVVLQKGTRLYSLAPGADPGFAIRGNTLKQAQGDAVKYHKLLQVKRDNLPPGQFMRTEVNEYILTEDICVAKGKALRNEDFGHGGATQFYIPASERSKLLKVNRIPI